MAAVKWKQKTPKKQRCRRKRKKEWEKIKQKGKEK